MHNSNEIEAQLAMIIERLDNTIKALDRYQQQYDKIAEHVFILWGKEKLMTGKIIGFSAFYTSIGFIISNFPIEWF